MLCLREEALSEAFQRESDSPAVGNYAVRRAGEPNSRSPAVYSNRVAVVVEQPVKSRFPPGPYTSAVPAEVYAVLFEFKAAS